MVDCNVMWQNYGKIFVSNPFKPPFVVSHIAMATDCYGSPWGERSLLHSQLPVPLLPPSLSLFSVCRGERFESTLSTVTQEEWPGRTVPLPVSCLHSSKALPPLCSESDPDYSAVGGGAAELAVLKLMFWKLCQTCKKKKKRSNGKW